MTTPETIVQRQLEAYNARDLDAFVACFSPDVVMRELQSDELIAEKHEGMRSSFAPLFEGCPSLHAEIVQRICKGSTVIDHERVTGMTDDGPMEAIAIYEVEDGQICRVWFA